MISRCKMCGRDFTADRRARDYCSRACSNKATGEARADKENPEILYSVWSSGGGIQSTAIAALIESGRLPKPDYGIMIDCGYEKETTLQYRHDVTIPRMKEIGLPFVMVYTLKYTNNSLTDGKGHVNIPAFRLKPDGTVSKLSTRCNNTWKVRVSRNWMRGQGINNCENWLGISTDEVRRAKPSTLKWVRLRYPLIELGMNREACVYAIAQAGWPMPPRTSCIFCPQQDDRAWLTTKNGHPDDWLKALEAERTIREECPDVFLNRYCVPLEEAFD